MSEIVTKDTTKKLEYAVKSWVHYDNLVSTFNKQAHNARFQKGIQEKEIADILGEMNQRKAVIEVNGAKLQFLRHESKTGLSWSWLQENLRLWYSSPQANTKGADDLYKFLQTKRSIKIQETLEKI